MHFSSFFTLHLPFFQYIRGEFIKTTLTQLSEVKMGVKVGVKMGVKMDVSNI